MMSCYQFRELISEYLDGEIGYAKRRLFEEHMDSCRDCCKLFNSVKVTVYSLRELPEVHVGEGFYLKLRNRIVEERERVAGRARKRRFMLAKIPSFAYGLVVGMVVVIVFFIVMKIQERETPAYGLPPYVKQQITGRKSVGNLKSVSFDRSVPRSVDGSDFAPDKRFLQIDTSELYLREVDGNIDKRGRSLDRTN